VSARSLNVSVVIPTYNSEATLDRCLKSVLAQGQHVREILVIDGGSTDATLLCARAYGLVRVIDDRHYSLTQAWNAGVQAASGDWIGFLDSDDWWSSDALRSHASAISAASARLGTAVRAITGSVEYLLEGPEPPRGFRKELLGSAHVGWMPGTTLVYRSVARAVGEFREEFGVVSDIDWLERLRRSQHVELNSNVVLFKTVRASSVSMMRAQPTLGASEYSRELLAMLRRRIR